MSYTLKLLVLAFLLPSVVFAQSKDGFYSGKIKCSSNHKTFNFTDKFEVIGTGISDVFYEEDSWQVSSMSPNSTTYKGTFVFDYLESDSCSGDGTLTIDSSGNYSTERSGTCTNLSNQSTARTPYLETCRAKLTYTSRKENISLFGSEIIRKTKCYNLKKETKFDYGFDDSGGYYARFKLVAYPCGGSQSSKTIKDFKKYQETASVRGSFSLRKGRWKFSVLSTDQWWIEGIPGAK